MYNCTYIIYDLLCTCICMAVTLKVRVCTVHKSLSLSHTHTHTHTHTLSRTLSLTHSTVLHMYQLCKLWRLLPLFICRSSRSRSYYTCGPLHSWMSTDCRGTGLWRLTAKEKDQPDSISNYVVQKIVKD